MSEAQAIETETEIDVEEVKLEVVEDIKPDESKETGAIEIEVEDAGKPPARRLSGFEKRLRKKSEQVSQAEAEAEALREENKLLRLAQQQASDDQLKEPDEDNFDSDQEYKAAQRAYNQQEIKRIASEQAQALLDQSQQKTTQATQLQQAETGIEEHYQRADSMNVKNYDELEGNATDTLGEDFIKTIIANTDDSHRIIASMGASPGKTAEIARLLKTNPVKAFASALRFEINPALSPASLKTAPDPEERVDPGSGVTSTEPGLEGVKFE